MRRLDPQERVDGLGDTSVPFVFDVKNLAQIAIGVIRSIYPAVNCHILRKTEYLPSRSKIKAG
ncbi:MAG: hypothetical protein OSJ43_00660 [Oscillospiraceae bacterium]|nr:hypothetical protein [Oscillospiraceae bacterium]